MSGLLKLLKGEPVVLGGAITATTTLLIALGVNQAICTAVGAAAVAWLLVARSLVTPVAAVAKTVHTAALDSAAQVASRLDEATVGPLGTITDHAAVLAETAANGAADAALRAAGIKRKDRAA